MREVDDQTIKEMFARLEGERRSEERLLRRLAYAAVTAVGAIAVTAVAVFGHLPPAHTNTPVAYARTPPDGGASSPRWANCGAYDRPVRAEEAVHSLEHGAVWITYRPGLPTGQVAQLHKLAIETYVIVSPYQNLPAPVVATAWHRQLRLPSPSDPQLATFVRTFRLGSQAPERGGPCTAGTGSL
jgi:hypothetical protein